MPFFVVSKYYHTEYSRCCKKLLVSKAVIKMNGVTDLNETHRTYPNVCIKLFLVRLTQYTKKIFSVLYAKLSHSYIHIIRPLTVPNDPMVELVKFTEWLPKSPDLNPLCHHVSIELK
jgi:hypothetical protein